MLSRQLCCCCFVAFRGELTLWRRPLVASDEKSTGESIPIKNEPHTNSHPGMCRGFRGPPYQSLLVFDTQEIRKQNQGFEQQKRNNKICPWSLAQATTCHFINQCKATMDQGPNTHTECSDHKNGHRKQIYYAIFCFDRTKEKGVDSRNVSRIE